MTFLSTIHLTCKPGPNKEIDRRNRTQVTFVACRPTFNVGKIIRSDVKEQKVQL